MCFYWTDATSNIDELIEELRPSDYDIDMNSRYLEPVNLGTWSSISDVDKFFTKYNHDNSYKSITNPLRLGDYVTIQDGTYNVQWMIAGFDMEHNQTAADGTTYDNGYGICMIPKTHVTSNTWNDEATLVGVYNSSTVHTSHLPNIVSNLQNVLGSHIVNRNVLLSINESGAWVSNDYTWTTAYATLMSVGQMSGTFGIYNTIYDDGEANYKLPVFNYMDYKTNNNFWTRCVKGYDSNLPRSYYINTYGVVAVTNVYVKNGIRPLIYLR